MKKAKIRECPFCGRIPSGERFCSTDKGPALMCDHCGVMGPSALDKEFIGADEDKFNPQAIAKWNQRTFDRDSYRMGIEAAASFVEQFDKYVSHPYLLSDCILSKFNLLKKGRLRKNDQRLVRAFSAAIRYFQVCFEGGTKVGHPDRVKAGKEFDRAMKEFCSYADRRTPARRKGERRIPGGPEFILGSLLSQERRQHTRREGARRRKA